MNITIAIPDDKVQAVVEAFAIQYKYKETIDDPDNPNMEIPNPLSKAMFAKNTIKTFIREVYTGAKVSSVEATRQQLIAEAVTETENIDVT